MHMFAIDTKQKPGMMTREEWLNQLIAPPPRQVARKPWLAVQEGARQENVCWGSAGYPQTNILKCSSAHSKAQQSARLKP
jgi:hypothetical protein